MMEEASWCCRHRRRQCSSAPQHARHGTGRRLPLPLLLLALLLLCGRRGCGASREHHVRVSSRALGRLAEIVERVPPPRGDPMAEMSDADRVAWAVDAGLTAAETLSAIEPPPVRIAVDLRLVGFDGGGTHGAAVDERALAAQLAALQGEVESVSLHPFPRHMAPRPVLEFRVSHAPATLARRVSAALAGALDAAAPSTAFTDFPLALVDPGAVAAVLDEDHATLHGRHAFTAAHGAHPHQQQQHGDGSGGGDDDGGSYTLYVLAPSAGAGKAYAYAYDAERRACPGPVHVHARRRYAFFDAAANVTFYGPGPGGRGQVLSRGLPLLAHYRPGSRARALPPDLAALAASAARHLVWPPLHAAHGVGFAPRVEVHVVRMAAAGAAADDPSGVGGGAAEVEPRAGGSPVDERRLEEELRAAVGGLQEVAVRSHALAFDACPACAAAYASALRVRTALPHEEAGGGSSGSGDGGDASPPPSSSRFLDVAAIGAWLAEWRNVVLSAAQVDPDVGGHSGGGAGGTRVVPVFVFDVAGGGDPVLLDGWRQAVALYSGDVVAVRSGAASVPTFFGCHGQQVYADPSELTRPVLAAVLQAAWGVADTAALWSPLTGAASWHWLWSVGGTPFGPLGGPRASLTFAQRDAMLRNIALAALNASAGHAAEIAAGFVALAGPDARVQALLAPDQAVPYNQRLALLSAKTRAASAALERADYATAVAYAASTAHDAAALHALARRARAGLALELRCQGSGERMRWYLIPAGAGAVVVALLFWRLLGGGPSAKADKKHMY